MSALVIDDSLLLAVTSGEDDPVLQPLQVATEHGELYTTGSWYWRLSRAVNGSGHGVLSRALAALPDLQRRRTHLALADLPDWIGLLSLRRLVPVMSALGGQLNTLTAEAIAAAVILEGELVVTTDSPLLNNAAAAAGIEVRIVTIGT